MISQKKLPQRIVIYCLGLLFIALGTAISINSNLGISPVSSLPNAIHLITGIHLSLTVPMIFSVYILLQILLLQRDFKWIQLTQILFSTLFGYFMAFALWLVGDFAIPTYLGSIVMLCISMALIALGVTLYVGVSLVPMPMEGLTLAISKKMGDLPFHKVKMVVDSIIVTSSALLSVAFLGGLYGVREGTVIAAICVGKMIPYIKKVVDPMLQKYN